MPIPGIAILGAVSELGGKLIDKLFPDKAAQAAERARAELALAELAQTGQLQNLQISMSAILAEAQSADPWTSRSRPAFLYVMYIMILMAIPMGFLSAFRPEIAGAIAGGMKDWLTAIPDELYTLFGVGYLGYTGARSWDKSKGITK